MTLHFELCDKGSVLNVVSIKYNGIAKHYSPSQPNQINQDNLFMCVCHYVCDFHFCEKQVYVCCGKPLLWCEECRESALVKLCVAILPKP